MQKSSSIKDPVHTREGPNFFSFISLCRQYYGKEYGDWLFIWH